MTNELRFEKRERIFKSYTNMWFTKDFREIDNIFSDDIVYVECYGPMYQGLNQIKLWTDEWQNHGKVLEWNIKHFVHNENLMVVLWYFKCDYDGVIDGFDGVSIVEFNENEKIKSIKEFQSKAEHYFPYQ